MRIIHFEPKVGASPQFLLEPRSDRRQVARRSSYISDQNAGKSRNLILGCLRREAYTTGFYPIDYQYAEAGGNADWIETVRGVGYRVVEDDPTQDASSGLS